MRKVIKILAKIVSAIILLLIFLPIGAALLLSIDRVQNYVIDRAATFASERLDSRVSIGRIEIDLLSKLHVHDFYVEDPERDTLLYVREAEAYITSLNIKNDALRLKDVEVVGAEFNLREMEDGELNVRPIVLKLTKPNKQSTFHMVISNAEISESRFRYERREHRNPEYGIDYYDMLINNIEGSLVDFEVDSGAVRSKFLNLYAHEQSGFVLDSFSGGFNINRGVIEFYDVIAETQESHIDIPKFVIDGQNWEEYKQYIELVDMYGEVQNSSLSTYDLGFFAPGVRNWNITLNNASGEFEGVVADFDARISSATLGEHTIVNANAHIIGMPDWQDARYIVGVEHLHTSSADVEYLVHNVTGKELPLKALDIIHNLRTFNVRGTFGGELYSFTTAGNIRTSQGDISADVTMRRIEGGRHHISGSATTSSLHLGKVIDVKQLGILNSKISVNGSLGSGGIIADINAEVDDIGIGRERFHAVTASANINGERYSLEVDSPNKDLNFHFSGTTNQGAYVPSYEFDINLRNADLFALGINKRDSISQLAMNLDCNVMGHSIDDIDGTMNLTDVVYKYPAKTLMTKHLGVAIHGDTHKKLTIDSEFADITFNSQDSYRDIYDYLINMLRGYIPLVYNDNTPSKYAHRGATPVDGNRFSILDVKSTDSINNLLNAINSDVWIAPNTVLKATINPESNIINARLESEVLEYKRIILGNTTLGVDSDSKEGVDHLNLWLTSKSVHLGTRPLVPNISLSGSLFDNHIDLSANVKDSTGEMSGLVALRTEIMRDEKTKRRSVHINIAPSQITAEAQEWSIDAEGIDIDSSRIHVRDLRIGRAGQQLIIDGIASRNRQDSIRLTLDNFDLAPLSEFVDQIGYHFGATSDGYATVRSALHNPQIDAHINLTDISVNDIKAPPQLLTSNWDFEHNRARVFIRDRNTRDTVIQGYYRPQDNEYSARAKLQRVHMSLIQPFLTDIISDIHGTADIEASIRGKGRQAELNGHGIVDSLSMLVDYTNTRYFVPRGVVTIENNHIKADKILVKDAENNEGQYTMDIDLSRLTNVSYYIDINADNMLVFDTDSKHNDLFYGHVYASGKANFRGDNKGMKMDIEASSEPNSTFFMPLTGKEDVTYADFIRFKEPERESVKSTGFLTERIEAKSNFKRNTNTSSGGMDISIALNVHPNIEAQLVIDPAVGDVIKGKGRGKLSMHIVPDTEVFEMSGDITLTEGTYLFTFQNIINKLFKVVEGSTISWNGDPMGAELNIDAVYSTKASLKPLLGNAIEGIDVSRAVPVDCYIKLTGPLTSPQVDFDIDVTNVAPEIQVVLNSVLNDQQAIATQLVWLLTANSFSAEDTGAMGASLSATTGFELLSSQLSNWLSGDNYNVVLRYRPRTDFSGDELDFGFSKGLLNNRLIIEVEGGYLSDPKTQTNNKNNIIASGSVTWFIDSEGAFRTRIYSQPIDRYGENQGMQEGGFGIYWKESFNNFKDLSSNLKHRFTNKKRRQRRTDRREARKAKKSVMNDTVMLEMQSILRFGDHDTIFVESLDTTLLEDTLEIKQREMNRAKYRIEDRRIK